jgi:tol-pal system-associated acyl-CoA thioesterase
LKEPFRLPVRVYYQDTDAGGVVFHAQYFAFMERARTELLNASRIDLARVAEEDRILFLVFEIGAKYHQPARLNDLLTVSAEVVRMGRASMVFRHRVEREGRLLVEADVTLALVDRDRMKPARLPERLAEELAQALK